MMSFLLFFPKEVIMLIFMENSEYLSVVIIFFFPFLISFVLSSLLLEYPK